MMRFVAHHLVEIMQIHCCSVKCCKIFGRETTCFFCFNMPEVEGAGFSPLAASLLAPRCRKSRTTSFSSFGVNQLLKVSKTGKLRAHIRCCCH